MIVESPVLGLIIEVLGRARAGVLGVVRGVVPAAARHCRPTNANATRSLLTKSGVPTVRLVTRQRDERAAKACDPMGRVGPYQVSMGLKQRILISFPILGTGTLALSLSACSPIPTNQGCVAGTEACPCANGVLCAAPLMCRSGVCVDVGADLTSGGPMTSGGPTTGGGPGGGPQSSGPADGSEDDAGQPATSSSGSSSGPMVTGGADPGAPIILSLESDKTSATLTEPVLISAIVTDPDGVRDVIGGQLSIVGSDAVIGTFQANAQEGAYSMSVTFEQLMSDMPGSLEPSPAPRVLEARFFDQSGAESWKTIEIEASCGFAGFLCGETCFFGECHPLVAPCGAGTTCWIDIVDEVGAVGGDASPSLNCLTTATTTSTATIKRATHLTDVRRFATSTIRTVRRASSVASTRAGTNLRI